MERSVCRSSLAAGVLAQLSIIGRRQGFIWRLWSRTHGPGTGRTLMGRPGFVHCPPGSGAARQRQNTASHPQRLVGEQLPTLAHCLKATGGVAAGVQGRQKGGRPCPRISAPGLNAAISTWTISSSTSHTAKLAGAPGTNWPISGFRCLVARHPARVWPKNAARAEILCSGLLCSRQARTLDHGRRGVTGCHCRKR